MRRRVMLASISGGMGLLSGCSFVRSAIHYNCGPADTHLEDITDEDRKERITVIGKVYDAHHEYDVWWMDDGTGKAQIPGAKPKIGECMEVEGTVDRVDERLVYLSTTFYESV